MRSCPAATHPSNGAKSLSGAHRFRRWRDLALGLLAGSLAFDAYQELLIEHGKDAVEHRDRRDVLTALQFRDVGIRGIGSPGDLLLGQVQLIAPLADVGGDPVPLAQRPDRRVLLPRRAVLLAAPGTAARRPGRGPALRASFAGPAAVLEAGKSGGVSTARSATTSAVPLRMT
jgi:hypothetical protein